MPRMTRSHSIHSSAKFLPIRKAKREFGQVARQMEGIFVQLMMKSMRSASIEDGLLNNDQTRLYTSMYDQQVGQQIASGKGLGLADVMVKQLIRLRRM